MRAHIGAIAPVVFILLGCDARPDATPVAPKAGDPGVIDILAEPVRVVIEAEKGVVEKPFEVEADAAAAGGACVVLAEKWETDEELHPPFKTKEGGSPVSKTDLSKNPLGSALIPNGSVRLRFEIATKAAYALWVRANFHCQCADSFFFALDAESPEDTDGNGSYDVNPPHVLGGTTYKRWKWFEFREKTFALDAGAHVLRIFPREDGIRIDQVLFVEIPAPPLQPYVPYDIQTSTK